MKGVNFMPKGKKMYSPELKYEIVQKYLDGKGGARALAAEYHVDKSDIQKWRDSYLCNGFKGLACTNGTYSGDFKVAAVEYMKTTGSSLRQTMAQFNIKSLATLKLWERIYYEEGPEALFEERRGRSTKLNKEKPKKAKNIENNEDLLAEVQRLRMENEYLKKLNALVQEREKSEKKTK